MAVTPEGILLGSDHMTHDSEKPLECLLGPGRDGISYLLWCCLSTLEYHFILIVAFPEHNDKRVNY